MIRDRHLSESALRDGWLGGVLAGSADRDMATAGSLSRTGGKQDSAQQRQGSNESHTNPPDAGERWHRVFAVSGHGS
jgi:hypothetical protein